MEEVEMKKNNNGAIFYNLINKAIEGHLDIPVQNDGGTINDSMLMKILNVHPIKEGYEEFRGELDCRFGIGGIVGNLSRNPDNKIYSIEFTLAFNQDGLVRDYDGKKVVFPRFSQFNGKMIGHNPSSSDDKGIVFFGKYNSLIGDIRCENNWGCSISYPEKRKLD